MALKNSLLKAYIWNAAGMYIIRSLGLVSTLILVRILTPEDFGAIAISVTILSFFQIMSNVGGRRYLIVNRCRKPEELSACWSLNIVIRLPLLALLFFMSGYISTFFNSPESAMVLKVLCLIEIIAIFNNNGQVLDVLDLNFSKINKMHIIAKIVSVIATIISASIFQNYWALIIGIFSKNFVTCILSYKFFAFRPFITFKIPKAMMSFSINIYIRNIVSFLRAKADTFIIGKSFKTEELGTYTIAQEFAILPFSEVISPATQPMLSALSNYKNQTEKLFEASYKYLSLMYLYLVPAIIGVYYTAPQITHVLLGEKWQSAAPVLADLAFLMLPFSLQPMLNNLFDYSNKTLASTLTDIFGIALLFGGYFYLTPETINDFSFLRAAIAILVFISMIIMAKIIINISFKKFIITLTVPTISTGVMCLVFHSLYFSESLSIPGLLANIIVGGASYAASAVVLLFMLKNLHPIWLFNYNITIKKVIQFIR